MGRPSPREVASGVLHRTTQHSPKFRSTSPLTAAKEHLPTDIINILELLGKADNIPFNQLCNLAEDCADRYYTKVIKTLTCLLKNSFQDRQLVLVNSARARKFLEPLQQGELSCGKCFPNMTTFQIIFMTSKQPSKWNSIY